MKKFKSGKPEKPDLVARTFLIAKAHVQFLGTLGSNEKSEFVRFLIDNSEDFKQHEEDKK